VHNFYGSSETGGICYDRDGRHASVESAIGEPLPGVELTLCADSPIKVRSAALCHAEYPQGVCILHDLGSLDADGVVHLSGRSADIIKIAGRRLSLTEVEDALCAVETVTDAYVSSREGRSGELRCVAIFTGDAEADAVRAALMAKLPDWKIPRVLRRVECISYTRRGKKDRSTMEALIDALIGTQ